MKTDKMILAENCIYSTDSEETQLNNNVIVVGASGSGKTLSVAEPCLMETYNSNLIVTVSKAKLINKYKTVFKARGYKVMVMDFVLPTSGNVVYDPMAYVSTEEDIVFLAKSIVLANPKKQMTNADPYWDDTAISLLCAEMAYARYKNAKATFRDVLALHYKLEVYYDNEGRVLTTLDDEFNALSKYSFASKCWRSFRSVTERTMRCIYGCLNTLLDTIFTRKWDHTMRLRKSVDFAKFSNEKSVLFILTSPVNPSMHFLANMFYAQAFRQLFEIAESNSSGTLTIPVRFLADDFAVGAKILDFPEYISIFREKKISVMLLIQSDSQLESMYGHYDAVTIRNNCDSYVYMGGNDMDTCVDISRRANLSLQDVMYMQRGKVIVFRSGTKPVITQRYPTLENELYQLITDKKIG